MATLLKLASNFTGNFKGLYLANSRKVFWRTLFLQNTSRWLFLSLKSFAKVLRVFQLYFDILLHSKCHALRAVSITLKILASQFMSTFTWDPKWTQTALKSQTTLKCCSAYVAIYLEISLQQLSKQDSIAHVQIISFN